MAPQQPATDHAAEHGASAAEFGRFYASNFPILRAQLARQFPRQADDVEDALQFACLKALESPAPILELTRFVARVATNRLLDRTRFDRRFQSDCDTLLAQLPAAGVTPDADVEADIARREACTERALDSVGDPGRAMILMKHKDGLNYDQIADALGLSKGSIGTTLLRARRRVKALADACLGVGAPSFAKGES